MMTLDKLLAWDATYIHHPTFHSPEAVAYLDFKLDATGIVSKPVKPPPDLPPFLRALYQYPVLTRSAEQALFLKFNYAKLLVGCCQERLRQRTAKRLLEEANQLVAMATATRNELATHNMRMVVHVCKQVRMPGFALEEIISAGNFILLRCIEKFDVSRLNKYTQEPLKFSTYGYNALKTSLWRTLVSNKKQIPVIDIDISDLDITEEEEDLGAQFDQAASIRQLHKHLNSLDNREQYVLRRRYGIDATSATLQEIGEELGITKERVRQLQVRATRQLSEEMGGTYGTRRRKKKTSPHGEQDPISSKSNSDKVGVPKNPRRQKRPRTVAAACRRRARLATTDGTDRGSGY